MNIKIIDNYINNLTKKDIYYFLNKQNIIFNNSEINFIYNYIKNNYLSIIKNTPEFTLNILKDNLSNESYQKIFTLFNKYKDKILTYQKIIQENN